MKIFNETRLAQELIRFQTIKTEDKGIIKFLSRKLSSIGFSCKIVKSKGIGQKPALNLFAKFGNCIGLHMMQICNLRSNALKKLDIIYSGTNACHVIYIFIMACYK